MVTPSAGATNVPDNLGVIQISTQTQVIVGTLALVPASGPTINLGTGTLDKQQPNPNAFLWDIKITGLQAHMAYTMQWTLSYPGGCLGPAVVQTHTVGGFTTL
jgi:hypothetical protein